jgi:hypothetical protein
MTGLLAATEYSVFFHAFGDPICRALWLLSSDASLGSDAFAAIWGDPVGRITFGIIMVFLFTGLATIIYNHWQRNAKADDNTFSLDRLPTLLQAGQITRDEYDVLRKQALAEMGITPKDKPIAPAKRPPAK